MSVTNLGKRVHLVYRDDDTLTGGYIDGEWVSKSKKEIAIFANIQPSTSSFRTQLLPVGDREKEAIAIYSNDWLHVARKGVNPLECDLISYRGALWEVVVSKPYGNYGQHCESLAIKLDETITPRLEGVMKP